MNWQDRAKDRASRLRLWRKRIGRLQRLRLLHRDLHVGTFAPSSLLAAQLITLQDISETQRMRRVRIVSVQCGPPGRLQALPVVTGTALPI